MLGWIKYLQRVRVETDALKRNKDLASTRTLLPRSGRGGRRFKSCHSDQLHQQGADRSHLSESANQLRLRRIHKPRHKRAFRMVGLKRNSNGSWSARKRLPNDVRDEYAALYGPRLEAKFSAPVGTPPALAKQLFNEWLAETEGNISAIRAQRSGQGVSLTPQRARGLAGEWYAWFIARHPLRGRGFWEDLRDQVHDALREAAGEGRWERNDPDDLWEQDVELRKAVRPVLADVGETAQFLAGKGLTLNSEARDRFLDWLCDDLAAALNLLIRRAQGDYSPDKYAERFPKPEDSADSGMTPAELFDRWIEARKPEYGTVESWSYVFTALQEKFSGRSAGSITPDEAREWIRGLITSGRGAHKRSPIRTLQTQQHAAGFPGCAPIQERASER